MTRPADWRTWPAPEKTRLRWALAARPTQRPPADAAYIWLIMAGRVWGKTRTGAEWVADNAWRRPKTSWGVFGPTYSATRDICVEQSKSGLLDCLGPAAIETYNRSIGEVILTNGSRIKLVSADEPERARGWNFDGAWCDELGSWRYPETFYDGVVLATRIGNARPRIVITTTPRSTPLIRDLYSRVGVDVVLTRGHSRENAENVGEGVMDAFERQYGGTRRGRQELAGELLEDVEGALWSRQWIEDHRLPASAPPRLGIINRIVVALDPADGLAEGDEQAIVVACRTVEHRYYVLHSEGVRMSPQAWLARAAALFEHFKADQLVYEKNHGGRFLTELLRTVAPDLPAKAVDATAGKRTRAEPISALYEQGKVSHVGEHDVLEDQLCTFTGAPGERSPDRLDALVWALTELAKGSMLVPSAPAGRAVRGLTDDLMGPKAIGF